jgi:hypothetical protein
MHDLFRPFFTTKEVGEGKGLGLAIAHQMIHSWGGSIHVESKAEEGKTKLDELIATALWKEWLSKGGLHMDDRLSTGNKQGKPKAVLTEALVKKYYGKNSPSTTNHQSNGNGMNGTSAPTGILLIAGQEIKQAIMGDDASFERYMKVNGKEIKQLSNLLSVLTQPDRKDALKKFSETLFPHA